MMKTEVTPGSGPRTTGGPREDAAASRSRDDASTDRPIGSPAGEPAARPGFVRRHRLPLALAFIAACLYAGSIVYILFGRGQIA